MRDDDYVPINGQVTSKEKEALESQAEELGYIHGRKGSIFRLRRAIARGDVILTRLGERVM